MTVIQRAKLSDKITEELLRGILDGSYAGAEYLPSEGELCDVFQVSRATIRDAVRSLVEKGIVERQHGRGLKIINRTLETVTSSFGIMMASYDVPLKDILDIRRFLEVPAARLAAVLASDEDIEVMRVALARMKDAATSIEEYAESDLKFHVQIAKASKNLILQAIFQSLAPVLLDCIRKTIGEHSRPEIDMPYHANIFDAIVQKNPDRAAAFMVTHLEGTEMLTEKAGHAADRYVLSSTSSGRSR